MNKRIKYIEGTNDILFLIQNLFGTHYLIDYKNVRFKVCKRLYPYNNGT